MSMPTQIRGNNYGTFQCYLACKFSIIPTMSSQTLNTNKYSLRIIGYPGANKDADPIFRRENCFYFFNERMLTITITGLIDVRHRKKSLMNDSLKLELLLIYLCPISITIFYTSFESFCTTTIT